MIVYYHIFNIILSFLLTFDLHNCHLSPCFYENIVSCPHINCVNFVLVSWYSILAISLPISTMHMFDIWELYSCEHGSTLISMMHMLELEELCSYELDSLSISKIHTFEHMCSIYVVNMCKGITRNIFGFVPIYGIRLEGIRLRLVVW